MDYKLIRSDRRTLALEITRDCRVVVRAPRRLAKKHIDDFVAGPGHNAEIMTDRDGVDWMLYHAYWVNTPGNRTLMLDRVNWEDGWPVVHNGTPSRGTAAPRF